MRMSENERIRPIFAEILSYTSVRTGVNWRERAFLCAGIKTLCTIAGMEKKSFVPLDGSKLKAETLDLEDSISQDQQKSGRPRTSAGVTRGGKVFIFASTLCSG